jgi:riboflavin biosynthesis pyrimidine reductase
MGSSPKGITVFRGWTLEMFTNGLVDEIRLAIMPVLLGDGLRLFETPAPNGDGN